MTATRFGKGIHLAPEVQKFHDERTGVLIKQLTNFPAIHHAAYFTNPSFTPDSKKVLFISYRSGAPNLFCTDEESGEITQLTDREDLNPWSVVPSADNERVFFTAGEGIWSVGLDGSAELPLATFAGCRLSNLSLSFDGKWVVTNVRYNDENCITAVRTDGSEVHTVLEADREVGHIQFAPSPDNAIQYSSDAFHRIWFVNFDGTDDRWLYQQSPDEWLTHETWLSADEIVFVHWKKALRAVKRDGTVRTIAKFNAWHPCPRKSDGLIVCDTNKPDIGLQLVDPNTGERKTLCYPESSNLGVQWNYDMHAEGYRAATGFAGDDPKEPRRETIYGPQWTHPHPSWSLDGKKVIFTSDRTGWSQVYVAYLPEEG